MSEGVAATKCGVLFFFQAEDGIRDADVTGVQTCALPISTVAMIDHMLEGRFIFGIGPGGLRSDMEVMGNLDADRGAMFVESIDQILALWAGEPPYDIEGKFWRISTRRTLMAAAGQGVFLKP